MLCRTFPRGIDHGAGIEVVRRKGRSQVVHGVEARRVPRQDEGEERTQERIEECVEARGEEKRREKIIEADEEGGHEKDGPEEGSSEEAVTGDTNQTRRVDGVPAGQ